MVSENVEVVAVWRDEITGDILKTQKTIEELKGTTRRVTTTTADLTKKQKKLTQSIKETTGKIKPFRMELLSVMFGAAAVSGALFGILQPSIDIVGTFDILKDALAVTFLPTAFKVQEWALDLFNTLTNLNPTIAEGIGDATLLTGGFFALLSLEATLGLFWDGMINKTGIMEGSVLKVNTALGLLSKALVIPLVLKGFDEVKTGETIAALSNFLAAAGFLIKTGPLKTVILGASLALSTADRIAYGKHATLIDYMRDAAVGGYIGWTIGGPWGAGIGVLATLFVNTVLSGKGGIAGEGEPFRVNLPSPSQVPAGVQAGPIIPNFAITSNVNVTNQPNIQIDWDALLPEIIRRTNETITTQIGNLSRR